VPAEVLQHQGEVAQADGDDRVVRAVRGLADGQGTLQKGPRLVGHACCLEGGISAGFSALIHHTTPRRAPCRWQDSCANCVLPTPPIPRTACTATSDRDRDRSNRRNSPRSPSRPVKCGLRPGTFHVPARPPPATADRSGTSRDARSWTTTPSSTGTPNINQTRGWSLNHSGISSEA